MIILSKVPDPTEVSFQYSKSLYPAAFCSNSIKYPPCWGSHWVLFTNAESQISPSPFTAFHGGATIVAVLVQDEFLFWEGSTGAP